ncbi:hypothetical protein GCK72_022695 [Caenorhabditis remanei]|uniref:Uncharacterized protein n=1 Tax=Caenorhabditis remanei TaxID=31234 RepID=A0A6A5FUK3_CAERE|nr:hypothetical protein GCK72_022695 [Caenorhabditis remanei]KAF1746242.1 hypothetical protein GCK72_022695 [Caenorhabditis remanei]
MLFLTKEANKTSTTTDKVSALNLSPLVSPFSLTSLIRWSRPLNSLDSISFKNDSKLIKKRLTVGRGSGSFCFVLTLGTGAFTSGVVSVLAAGGAISDWENSAGEVAIVSSWSSGFTMAGGATELTRDALCPNCQRIQFVIHIVNPYLLELILLNPQWRHLKICQVSGPVEMKEVNNAPVLNVKFKSVFIDAFFINIQHMLIQGLHILQVFIVLFPKKIHVNFIDCYIGFSWNHIRLFHNFIEILWNKFCYDAIKTFIDFTKNLFFSLRILHTCIHLMVFFWQLTIIRTVHIDSVISSFQNLRILHVLIQWVLHVFCISTFLNNLIGFWLLLQVIQIFISSHNCSKYLFFIGLL